MKAIRIIVVLSCILFTIDSNASSWFKKSNFGGDARHRATAFSIGNHGYMGLGHVNAGSDIDYEDFWKYDPASDSWTQIANYPGGKCFHATAFVIGNKGYVGTGRLTNGSYTKMFYAYDPQSNTWTQIADFLGAARRGAVAFALNGKGYVGTGQTSGGYVSDLYEYNPATNAWIIRAALPGPGRTSSVALSIDNFGYLGTGNTSIGSINDFYQYNPSTNQWIAKAPVGPTNRQEAAGFSVNGKGYIGTGDDFSSGNNFPDFWEYDPLSNTWTQIDDFAGTARRYLVGMTIGNKAYVGTGTNGTNFNDFWLFDKTLGVLQTFFENTALKIYPNPATEAIHLNLALLPETIDSEKLGYKIIDPTGNVLMHGGLQPSMNSIDLKPLENGWYLLVIYYNNSWCSTRKFLKI